MPMMNGLALQKLSNTGNMRLPEMASLATIPADTAPFSAEQLTWLRATFGPDCVGADGRASSALSAPGGSLPHTDPLPSMSTGEQRRGSGLA